MSRRARQAQYDLPGEVVDNLPQAHFVTNDDPGTLLARLAVFDFFGIGDLDALRSVSPVRCSTRSDVDTRVQIQDCLDAFRLGCKFHRCKHASQ